MSAHDPIDRDGTTSQDESFLSRWSRRKAQTRAAEPVAAVPPVTGPAPGEPAAAPVASPPAASPATGTSSAQAPPPVIELPNLDLLGDDSDYSAFLTPGVDADLRRRALRQLFSSPKFNVFDGLDTYRDDYTQFPALGSIVTADMRYHVERLAKKVAEVLDEQTAPVAPLEPVAPAAAIAATQADDAPVAPEASAVEPPAPAPDEENHDSPA